MSLTTTTNPQLRTCYWLCAIGALLLLQQLLVTLIDEQFLFGLDISLAPIRIYVASQILAGFAFLGLLLVIPNLTDSKKLWLLALLLGLTLRLFLFDSQPILEIDFYRYLWDGAVTAAGFNPWMLAPADISGSALQALAEDSGPVIERINYAELRSIYPPLTQLYFALAFWLENWSLDAWRLVLLLNELIAMVLVVKILEVLNRSRLWALLYWWNPLLIHETYNTLHMDVLILPLLLLAILCLLRQKYLSASAALTLAAGIKLWPLLLLPFALRPLLNQPQKLVYALLISTGIATFAIAPLFYFGLGDQSGLQGYSQGWIRNSALFPILNALIPSARFFIALSLCLLVITLNRRAISDNQELMRILCWVVAALFLLSPTQFPWYTIWFAPLLCFYPKPALLLLTALMPVYYLRVYYSAQGNVELFDQVIVWIQYAPVYALLLVNLLRQRQKTSMVNAHV